MPVWTIIRSQFHRPLDCPQGVPNSTAKFPLASDNGSEKSLHSGHRFPPEIISHAVLLDHRFTLSFRYVDDLLPRARRGRVLRDPTRQSACCRKLGPALARQPAPSARQLGNALHVDEVFIRISGERRCLWMAVDQDGNVLNTLVTRHRDASATLRFFREPLMGKRARHGSWSLTSSETMPPPSGTRPGGYPPNRAVRGQTGLRGPARERECQMRCLKGPRALAMDGAVTVARHRGFPCTCPIPVVRGGRNGH